MHAADVVIGHIVWFTAALAIAAVGLGARNAFARRFAKPTRGYAAAPLATPNAMLAWYGRTLPAADFRAGAILLAACSAPFSMAPLLAKAGDVWPSFHNGGDTSLSSVVLPLEWSPEAGVAWKTALAGYGQSAPVVWNDRLFVTSIEGDEKETCLVCAYDAASGGLLWERRMEAATRKANTATVARAAPTPLVDADGLYVLYESGDFAAWTHDGELRWRLPLFDDGERAFQGNHGYGASPAQTSSAIVVLVDHKGPSYIAAFSKENGEPLWKTERSSRSSWSSPVVARPAGNGGAEQIVVSSAGSVDAYDAATGELLWSHEGVAGNSIPSASVSGDRVYVGASEGRGGSAEQAATSNCCLRLTPGGERPYELLWRAEKAVCSYVSPLAHRGYVYYVNNVGVLRCVDAETGKQRYETRMGEPCWAQPIACDDRLYFFGKRGVTKVIQAGPEYRELAANRLWPESDPPLPAGEKRPKADGDNAENGAASSTEYLDPLVYAAVAIDGAFFVRLGTHLFRIDGPTRSAENGAGD